MIPDSWLIDAEERLSPYILRTPISFDGDARIYLKWENHQISGSFKLRGAYNKILTLQPWELNRGIVTASAGNHGRAVAQACNRLGIRATIFVSQRAVPSKVQAMQNEGAEVRAVAGGYGEAERTGIEFAHESGGTWISPYNDGQVIAGQGTLALETVRELEEMDDLTWVVPVGGGGLISGVGAVLHSSFERTRKFRGLRLIGVQSEASSFFHSLFHHGTQQDVEDLPSLADGLSGEVELDSLTIPLVRSFVDDLILVSEDEIARAMASAWHRYGEIIEGSAATALAAVESGKITQRPAVLLITGGNVQPDVHKNIIEQFSDLGKNNG